MAAPPIVNSYVCDWLPYRRSNAYFRTLVAATPEDWTGAALTIKADDTSRFAEVAAGAQSTWTPQAMTAPGEVLALLYMKPGLYGGTRVQVTASVHVTIDTTAGTIGGVALPASVWTSSSNYGSAWVRVQNPGGTVIRVRVWSPNEAEPGTWLIDSGSPGSNAALAPGLGHASVSSVSACRWFAYGPANQVTAPRMLADPAYYDKWFAQAATGAPRVLTAEIYVNGYDGSNTTNYTTAVLRVATQAYEGGAAWPYTNQLFADGIIDMPTLERKLSDDLFGRQSVTFGDLVVANPLGTDGKGIRDDWLRAKLQKAVLVLRYGDPNWPWFDHATVMTGEVTDVVEGNQSLVLRIRDTASRYDKAVARSTLTTGANTGKPTPIVTGSVFNVSPPPVDTSALLYKVGEANVNAITDVRDRGVSLTGSVTVATVESYDTGTNIIRTTGAHGRSVGNVVQFPSAFAGLSAGVNYFVKTVPASDQLTLAATLGGATITLTGSPTFTIAATFPFGDLLRAAAAHGLTAGAYTRVVSGAPGGTTVGTQYAVPATGLTSTDFKLETPGGSPIDLTATIRTVQAGFSGQPYVTLDAAHGYTVNQELAVESTMPGGYTTPGLYFYRNGAVTYGNAQVCDLATSSGGTPITNATTQTGGKISANQSGAVFTKYVGIAMQAPAWVLDAAAGTLQLGSNPAGQITVDMQGQKLSGSYSASAAHAVKVFIGASNPLVSTKLGSGTGYDNFNLATGVWIDAETNLMDVLDLLARSCASVWACNRLGTLTATAFFDGYAGTPTATIVEDRMTSPLRMVRKYLPVDYYEGVRIAYGRNYTVQKDADLAGSVTTTQRDTYAAQWQYAVNHQGGSGNLAGLDLGEKGDRRKRPAIETALTRGSSTNANLLRDNLVVSPAKQQAVFELTAKWTALDQYQVARSVSVKTGRFGWGAGKSFLVIGTKESLKDHTVALTLLTDLDGYYPVTT